MYSRQSEVEKEDFYTAATNADLKAVNTYIAAHFSDADFLETCHVALGNAVARGNTVDIIKALISTGVDVNKALDNHDTPLMIAAFSKNILGFQTLLAHPAIDFHGQNQHGETILHVATKYNVNFEIIKMLLEHPKMNVALLQTQDERGNTAYEYAKRRNEMSITLLIEYTISNLTDTAKKTKRNSRTLSRSSSVTSLMSMFKRSQSGGRTPTPPGSSASAAALSPSSSTGQLSMSTMTPTSSTGQLPLMSTMTPTSSTGHLPSITPVTPTSSTGYLPPIAPVTPTSSTGYLPPIAPSPRAAASPPLTQNNRR